jgi:hypothetical protein
MHKDFTQFLNISSSNQGSKVFSLLLFFLYMYPNGIVFSAVDL